ncbi:MAG TPA: RNA polymerase sigma factor [Bryobacteraceae bacterium]|nr:RNA polymerase sigma factor [Bryobacteraceae bacterium]
MDAAAATIMTDEADGVDLLRRAQSGDLAAFEGLVRRYERRVFLTALRLLGNHADAEDAAQEVFFRLHRSLRRMDPDRDPAPWIYRITVNACRDLARARPPAGSVEEPSAPGGTEEEIGRRERRSLVARALGSLPAKQRAALVLRDIEGLSTREVAEVLGSSEATVRSQVSTGRVRVKQWIERILRRRS